MKSSIIMGLIILGLMGCQKGSKKGDLNTPLGGAVPVEDLSPEISDQALNFDALGSDGGQIEGLYTLRFQYNLASFTEEEKSKLVSNAEWIKSHPGYVVQIEGHADPRGTSQYNLALGERRAKAIREYLIGLGVNPNQLTTVSYGEEKLLDTTDSEVGYAVNRRANFVPMKN